MSDYRCPDGRHRFAKFDDATIFCERCGEQRVMDVQALIRALPAITYLPCPGPHWQPTIAPTWRPYPWPGYTITNGTVQTGNTVMMTAAELEANSTYTVQG